MEAKFLCALKDSGHCIKIDHEGCGEFTLVVSSQELARALLMATMGGKVLECTVKESKSSESETSLDEWRKEKKTNKSK